VRSIHGNHKKNCTGLSVQYNTAKYKNLILKMHVKATWDGINSKNDGGKNPMERT